MAEATSWTERYRPKTLDEVVGNPSAVRELRAWARAWAEGKPKKPGVVLVGEAGIGKTSAALALAAEMGWTPIELNASDARTASVIDQVVTRGALAQTFSATGEFQRASEGHRKLLILDEADNVFGREDRGGMQQIVATLRETQQPMVLIANDAYALRRKAAALGSLTIEIKFQRAQAATVAKVLIKIAKAEGIEADPEAIELLADHAGGDLRAAVTDLEALAQATGRLTVEDVESLGYRDARSTIFDALRTILGGGDFRAAKEAARSLDEDPESLLLWVEENVPRAYTHPEDLARAMDRVARADQYIAVTRKTQNYRFWAVAGDLVTGGVAAAQHHRTGGWARYQFPSWLRKMSSSRAQRALRDKLATKVGAGLHAGRRDAREELIPLLAFLMARDEALAVHVVRELDLEADELGLLIGEKPTSKRVKALLSAANPPDEVKRVKAPKAKAEVAPAEEPSAPDEDEEDGAPAGGAERKDQKSLFEF